MKTKKVVLFIVEGISDQTSLALILSRLIKSESVRFHIVNGDITSDYQTTGANVITKVNEQIKRFLNNNFLKKTDILKIVQLVDADGAFVGKEYIEEDNIEGFLYSSDSIKAKNTEAVMQRNQRKSSILNKLSTCSQISGIAYELYYFSCNLEHVLHNDCNIDDNKKDELAEGFSDKFYGKEIQFVEFISNKEFAVHGDFKATWEFIKLSNNSLNRYSNFHLFFKN